jgi:hypothetical protein
MISLVTVAVFIYPQTVRPPVLRRRLRRHRLPGPDPSSSLPGLGRQPGAIPAMPPPWPSRVRGLPRGALGAPQPTPGGRQGLQRAGYPVHLGRMDCIPRRARDRKFDRSAPAGYGGASLGSNRGRITPTFGPTRGSATDRVADVRGLWHVDHPRRSPARRDDSTSNSRRPSPAPSRRGILSVACAACGQFARDGLPMAGAGPDRGP